MRFPALTSCLPRLEGIAWRATSSRSIAAGVTIMPLKSAGTPSSAMSCSARFRHHLAADTDHDQPEDGQGRCLPKRLPLFLALSHSFGEEKLPVARDANQVHHCTDKGQEQNHPCPSWGEGPSKLRPESSGLAANRARTPCGSRTARGKSREAPPRATQTRKMAPPKMVPRVTGAAPRPLAANPTAIFLASKPERTAPTAKAEKRSNCARLTSPSRSRSVANTARMAPTTKNHECAKQRHLIPTCVLSTKYERMKRG